MLGYHGGRAGPAAEFAKALLLGEADVAQWQPSENEYDWLGQGIYFWEHSPERARRWAGPDGIVIGAVIQLGDCLDLTDLRFTSLLEKAHARLVVSHKEQNSPMPSNEGQALKLRKLDCLVINNLVAQSPDRIQTVRGAFEEGEAAFAGAALKKETHIQIAVRDLECILGVFRPTFFDEQ
ncbi:MAG: hypothetical protein AB7O62_22140 [Pirellulales bacterium]